jgi:Rps23 Pro-64 3,4-dihydroxylase Tpa1-like proline 4-hydroxylase
MQKFQSQDELKSAAVLCAEKVTSAQTGVNYFEEPFKHIVIDNFLPAELAEQCFHNFPDLGSDIWDRSNDPEIEVKLRTKWKSEFDIPEGILPAIKILNSSIFLSAMSERIGIPKLIPDPYYSGGGLNVTVRGGLLDVHIDGNYHDATGLNRRVNAIIYLNPGWQEGWGGEFGLYDSTGDECLKAVAPLFNRMVIFDTHDFSFHGLPNPLNFPEGHERRSIILYYYTKDPRPSDQIQVQDPHSALWKKKNLTDKRGNKTREHQ